VLHLKILIIIQVLSDSTAVLGLKQEMAKVGVVTPKKSKKLIDKITEEVSFMLLEDCQQS